MTITEMQEIVTLAREASEAAEKAGQTSRSRFVDIQLTTVREKTSQLVELTQKACWAGEESA